MVETPSQAKILLAQLVVALMIMFVVLAWRGMVSRRRFAGESGKTCSIVPAGQ